MLRRRRALLLSTLLVVAQVGGALSAQPAVEFEPVTDGVWLVRRAYVGSNAVVIVGTEGVVVVDSHVTPAAAKDTLAAIRRLTDAPVRFLIDTHWHTDHSVGAAGYLEAFPDLQVISHHSVREDLQEFGAEQMEVSVTYIERDLERAEERLAGPTDPWDRPWTAESRESLHRFLDAQRAELEALGTMEFTLPDLTLERKLTIHRPEGPIHLLYLGRGHTRGDIVAFLPEQRVLVSGDLVTAPRLHVGSHSRPSEWVEVLRQLERLEFDHILPGHGERITGKDYLRRATDALSWVVGEVRAGLAQGLKYEDLSSRITLEKLLAEHSEETAEAREAFERMGPMIEDAVGRTYLELTGRMRE